MSFKVVRLSDLEDEPPKMKKSTPYMTRFEFTKLVAARALALQAGADPLINRTSDMVLIDVAESEVRARLAPLAIRRTFPDGSYEDWKLSELEMRGF